MDLSDIRQYIDRDWGVAARAEEVTAAELGAAAALSRIDAARHFVRSLRPDWPGEAARAEDLEHHVRLSALFRRAQP